MNKKGLIFRLEHLVILIIFSALVFIFINRLGELENKAIVTQEKGIINSLSSALYFQYMQNATNTVYNSRGTAWPLENPFSFLSRAPAYAPYSDNLQPDANTWRWLGPIRSAEWGYGYYIYCPHFSEKSKTGDRFFYTAWDQQHRYEGKINLDLSYHKH